LLQITDLGTEWQRLTNALPEGLNNVKTMAYTPDEDLLIGGQNGIFASSDRGQRWQSLNVENEVQLIRTIDDVLFVVLRDGRILTSTGEKTWFDVSPNP